MPKALNIYVELPPVENDMTVEDIAQRVAANKDRYQAKFENRKARQDNYYSMLKQSSVTSQ